MQFLQIKVPKDNEYTTEQTYALLANLISKPKLRFLFFGQKTQPYSLEILCSNQLIKFIVGVPKNKIEFFKAQLLAQYKQAIIEKVDFKKLKEVDPNQLNWTQMQIANSEYLPLKTMEEFKDTDPLSSVLATMAKSQNKDNIFLYQILLLPARKNWQYKFNQIAETGGGKNEHGDYQYHPQKRFIEEKTGHPGFQVYIRLLTNSEITLNALQGSFGIYTKPSCNQLTTKSAGWLGKNKLLKAIFDRTPYGASQILNLAELSSMWHLPNEKIKLPNIAWGKQRRVDAPENLPHAIDLNDAEKQQITFIAETEYKNQKTIFGIKRPDRARHIYVIGKTGTGKSWMLANMAIEDIRKNQGVAVIDPHGDLINILLNYIPKHRINDVCYFNPADPEYSYPLNPLEVKNKNQRELVASGIVSIFHKLYGHSWGPRMEHILRNTLLTLTSVPNTTLADVIKMLTDKKYRNKIVSKIDDQILTAFWQKEFERMDPNFQSQAISPILNKVGQFVSSPSIRKIINNPQSKVDIEEIMNTGKILLCDLSQGKLGEDNSALLGAMVITQIQLAAMNRVFIPEPERKPFYLFVDEFQNFATGSFIKILSEARKYNLSLTVANQYLAQLDEDILNAALGNVGTLISFLVGAQDAHIMQREFGKDFEEDDMVSLGRYEILTKLCIDNETSNPFYATTLPLPNCTNQNRDTIISVSRERYGVKK